MKKDNLDNLDNLIHQAQNVVVEKDHEKLYALVMGNLYLRKAQIQYEFFKSTGKYYKLASSYLDEHIRSEDNDEISCLMLLNKGKFFRNTAIPGRKSNYEKAREIFEDVIDKAKGLALEQSKKIHIILDAAVNMGRVLRYSYNYEGAKLIFSELILKLKKGNQSYEEKITELTNLFSTPPFINKSILPDDIIVNIPTEYVKEYLLQSLIHIGIILRKKREYEKAIPIFELVNHIDSNGTGEPNIDAQNNLGVCYRKLAELETYSTIKGQEHYKKAIDIFEKLEKNGNNFATINRYKCELIHSEKHLEEIIAELNEKNNSCVNNNIKMLLARFYEKNCNFEKAEILFREIYYSLPYITRGSLGLKAYYHIAQCKMALKEYHQAYSILQKIRELFCKNTNEVDILTEIDLGWCLMQNGNYKKAATIYESLINKDLANLESKYLMRIRNNLCQCYIHNKDLENAKTIVKEVLSKEPDNRTGLYFQAYIHLNSAFKSLSPLPDKIDDVQSKNLDDACCEFSKLLNCKPIDDRANSGWIISMILKWKYASDKNEIKNKIKDELIEKLKYSSEAISMKCYILLTDFVLEMIKTDEESTLYHDYCHIKLTDNMENRAFEDLMANPNLRYFDQKSQTYILAYIVKIYEKILEIKNLCRLKFTDTNPQSCLPVHYTSIDTLKILLQENSEKETNAEGYPKLRLWNTVYMNDDFEGGVFDELLLNATKKKYNHDTPNHVKDVLNKYLVGTIFQSIQSSNVYIISFSKAYNSFQMWDIYAKKGRGCTIRFGEDFFNIQDDYEDLIEDERFDGNTLYAVQYYNLADNINEKIIDILSNIWEYIDKLDEILYLPKTDTHSQIKNDFFEHAQVEVQSFVTDKLNEIRYLFKTHLFQYEEELRLVRFSHKSMSDDKNFNIPRLYIEIDKKIENIDVELGNKLTLNEIKELSTWLNNTQKVNKITVANFHIKEDMVMSPPTA